MAAILAALTTAFLQQRALIAQNQKLQTAYHDLSKWSAHTVANLRGRIDAWRADGAEQDGTIETLNEIQAEMAERLATGEQRYREVKAERDRALRDVRALEEEIQARDMRLESALNAHVNLTDQLATTHARLIEVSDQRDESHRSEAGLRWRLASIQSQLERLGARQAIAQSWLEGWVLGNLETLEELVAGTGVDVEMLVARAATANSGQGGPLEAMADPAVAEHSAAVSVTDHILRLNAMQRLASSLPLASPLDQFHITSRYGKRQDPFTGGWAFHGGLDLGGPADSEILATAPGIVRVAGPSGPYGNMVEIDHGMGVVTRYGHLKSVATKVGDQVGFRQQIGVIGNSGRSTSVHLHYEIRVDGAPHDPGRFLDAGRYLVAIFDVSDASPRQDADGG